MESKIVKKNRKLLLNINGETFVPSAYMSYVPQRADYEGFKNNGCRLFFACMYMGDTFTPFESHIWKGENEYDFTPLKNTLQTVIGNSKVGEVYVMLRVNLNAPKWWIEKYPDEIMETEQGVKWLQSPASKRWREDCIGFLRRLQAYIVENGYEEYIAGWHLAALATEEWYIPEAGTTAYDFSPKGAKAFQGYCQNKYKNINALNEVWKKEYSDFSEIKVPTYAERHTYSFGEQYRNKETDMYGSDYFSFCNDLVTDAIIYLCTAAKEILNDKVLVGAFYGYVIQLPAWRGHSAFEKILSCKAIDFFASPFAYQNLRQGAHDWLYHSAMDSTTNVGKIWFLEADVRTYRTEALPDCCPWLFVGQNEEVKKRYYQPVWFGPKTEEQSKHHLTRSLGKVLASGNAFWWFDMWGGWFKSKGLMSHMQKICDIYQTSMLRGDKNNAEIAIVVDEKMSMNSSVGRFCEFMYDQVALLGFTGAPYDIYLFTDIVNVDLTKYKTVIFSSTLTFNEELKNCVDKLRGDNRSLLFTGFPGLYSGDAEEILQISHKLSVVGKEIKVDLLEEISVNENVYEKQFDDYRIWWSHFKKFTSSQVREALRKAGGHVYNEQGDIIYANEKYITWTSVADGKRRLALPAGKSAKIIVNAKEFTEKSGVIELEIHTDETVMLELE